MKKPASTDDGAAQPMQDLAERKREDEIANTFATGFVFKMGSMVINKLLGGVFQVIVLRFLGATEAGLYAIAYALVVTITTFMSMGLGSAVVRYVPGHAIKREYGMVKNQIYTSTIATMAVSAIVCIGLLLFSNQIAGLYGEEMRNLLIPAATLAVLMLNYNFLTSVLDSLKDFAMNSVQTVGLQVLRVGAFIAVVFALGITTAYGAIVTTSFAFVVLLAYLIYRIYKKMGKIEQKPKFSMDIIKSNLSFGIPAYLSSMADIIVTYMDILIMGIFLPPSVVAGYAAVMVFVRNIGPFVFAPINSVAQPLMVEQYETNKKYFDKMITEIARWTMILGVPVVCIFVLYPAAIMDFLYPQYRSDAVLMLPFSVMILFSMLSSSARNALFSSGNIRILLGISILMLGLNFALNWYFVQAWGSFGAAFATTIAIATGESIAIIAAYRLFKARLHEDILLALIAGFITFVLGMITIPSFGMTLAQWADIGLLELIGGMAISCTIYSLLLWLLGVVKKSDFDQGMSIAKRTGLDKYASHFSVLRQFLRG